MMKSAQPRGLAMRMPLLLDEAAVDRALGVVLGALVGRELDLDALGLVLGEELAGQLGDVPAVDDRADQLVELGLAAVGALGRGGQAEAERRERAARGERVRGARQVVALVEDDQAEAGAEVLHVEVGGVVGGDGERLDVVARRRRPRRPRRRRWCAAGRTTGAPGRAWARRPAWRGAWRRSPCTRAASCRRPWAARPRRGCAVRATRRAPRPGRGAARGARARRARGRRSARAWSS